MSLITRAGVAVFAVVLGSALAVARADEKASTAADAKGEAVKAQKAKADAAKADGAGGEAVKSAAGEAKAANKSAARLVQPWNKLTSLSDAQKHQIHAIHQKALAEMAAIRKRERADIQALLTDEQKSELREIAAQQKKADAEKRTLKKSGDKQEADKAEPKADEKKTAKDAA